MHSSIGPSMVLVAMFVAGPQASAEVHELIEEFTGGDVAGFGGGSNNYAWIASGGVGGVNDGYLHVENYTPWPFAAMTAGPDYTGNWRAANISRVMFHINDVNECVEGRPFEIHVGIGIQHANVWLYREGCIAPCNVWQRCEVDVTDESKWWRATLSGTFEEALQSADRLVFRHDDTSGCPDGEPDDCLDELGPNRDTIAGDLGIDRIVLLADCESLPHEPDCNHNDVLDDCDIANGTSDDINQNGVPDECEGACCLGDGSCVIATAETCSNLGGIRHLGGFAVCLENQQNPSDPTDDACEEDPYGRCCGRGLGEHLCVIMPRSACRGQGFFGGAGSDCQGDANGNGLDDACRVIPAVSEWGLAAMTLLVLTAGTIVLLRRRAVLPG